MAVDPQFDEADLVSRLGDDVELAQAVAQAFIANMDSMIATVRDAVGARDLARIRETAHRLKGAAQNTSLKGLAQHAHQLEQTALDRLVSNDMQFDDLTNLMKDIDAMMGAIHTCLTAFLTHGTNETRVAAVGS